MVGPMTTAKPGRLIRLPPEIWEAIIKEAEREQRSVTNMVQVIATKYLSEKEHDS